MSKKVSFQMQKQYILESSRKFKRLQVYPFYTFLIVTRLTSASIADQFSLVWSIGTLWVVIGLFQVRNYHGTDVRQNHSFIAYFQARILTIFCHVGNLVSLPKDSRRKSVYLIYYFNVISDDFIPCLGLYF